MAYPYFQRLAGQARKKLQGSPRRAAGEEDVALSAFDSFCRNAQRGRFPQLQDWESLWKLLVVITARKADHLLPDSWALTMVCGTSSEGPKRRWKRRCG
jgi:hypothetical protein